MKVAHATRCEEPLMGSVVNLSAAPGRAEVTMLPPKVTLRQLAYFSAVAGCENITRAAEQLHVSPPSISVALAELEALVGTPLFKRRHARGLVLTETGVELVRIAREILALCQEFRSRGDERAKGYEGVIDFGCLVSLAPLVPALVNGFYKDYPKIRVRWHEGDHAALLQGLETGAIACALIYDFDIPSGIACSTVREMPLQVVLSKEHCLAARCGAVSLSEMAQEPFVLLDLPNTSDFLLSVFRDVGVEPNVQYRAHSFEMLRSLVANGFGYALLNYCPPYMEANGGGLVCRPIEEHCRPCNMVFARRQRHQVPYVVEAFKEHIVEFMSDRPVSA